MLIFVPVPCPRQIKWIQPHKPCHIAYFLEIATPLVVGFRWNDQLQFEKLKSARTYYSRAIVSTSHTKRQVDRRSWLHTLGRHWNELVPIPTRYMVIMRVLKKTLVERNVYRWDGERFNRWAEGKLYRLASASFTGEVKRNFTGELKRDFTSELKRDFTGELKRGFTGELKRYFTIELKE